MLKRIVFILILLATVKAAATENSAPVKAYVWTTGNPEKIKQTPVLRGPNYEVLSPHSRSAVDDGSITPHDREALFHRTGIDAFVGGMDDMDKDLLVEEAGELPLANLRRLHPKIPAAPLTKLIQEVKARK